MSEDSNTPKPPVFKAAVQNPQAMSQGGPPSSDREEQREFESPDSDGVPHFTTTNLPVFSSFSSPPSPLNSSYNLLDAGPTSDAPVELKENKVQHQEMKTEVKKTSSMTMFESLERILNLSRDNLLKESKQEDSLFLPDKAAVGTVQSLEETKETPIEFSFASEPSKAEPLTEELPSSSSPLTEEKKKDHQPSALQMVIDQNDGVELNAHLDNVAPNTIDLRRGLRYAVMHSYDQAAACLLARLAYPNSRNLARSELNDLLALCMQRVRTANQKEDAIHANDTLKAFFLALPQINNGNYINDIIKVFSESRQLKPSEKNRYIFWLLKIKLGVPLEVSTTKDLPVLWVMKTLAETVNVREATLNLEVIKLLAKTAVSQHNRTDPTLQKDLTTTVDLAIALDNSQDKFNDNTGPGNPRTFKAVLDGISEGWDVLSENDGDEQSGSPSPLSAPKAAYISTLLLSKLSSEQKLYKGNVYGRTLQVLTDMIQKELVAELNKYLCLLGEAKFEAVRNIKTLSEIITAIHNKNYGLAKILARKLPSGSDQRVKFKKFMTYAIPLLIPINIAVVCMPSIPGVNAAPEAFYTALAAMIVMSLPLILKLNKYLDKTEFFAGSNTIRAQIEELRPKTSFWHSISKSTPPPIQANLARDMSLSAPDTGKHPLAGLGALFEHLHANEIKRQISVRSGDRFADMEVKAEDKKESGGDNTEQAWKRKFDAAVATAQEADTDEAREKVGDLLDLATRNGIPLGRPRIQQNIRYYPNSDPLVSAFVNCLQKPDIKMFRTLLMGIKDESRYGKFTFDLLGMVLNDTARSVSEKNQFMYTIVQAKLGKDLNASEQVSEVSNCNLHSSLQAMLNPRRYENRYHLRVLSMMSKLAMKGFREEYGSVQKLWLADISAALSVAASLNTAPISPHGYVDAFSAIMSGLFSGMASSKLTDANRDIAIELMTFQLQHKIEEITRSRDTHEAASNEYKKLDKQLRQLISNKGLIETSMRTHLEAMRKTDGSFKTKEVIDLNYEHLKKLVHYASAICESKPKISPLEIWRSSAELQEQGIHPVKALPYVGILCYCMFSLKDYTFANLGINLDPAVATGASVILMLLITVAELRVQNKRESGAFMPEPVRAYRKEEADLGEQVAIAANPKGALLK